MKNTKQQNLSISPNSTTKYSNTITVRSHIKQQSYLSPTHNDITTIDNNNNTSIQTQNNIKYSDSYSSVSTTKESDKTLNNLQKKEQ